MTVPKNDVLVQGLLRSGIPLAEIIDKYKLKVNRSKRHNNLVQLKYDQVESDLSDSLVQQCRGLILDESDNWEVVARPFDKFFNIGEPEAASIDWKTARVVEKLDGTCCFLYYYDGWHVATLGSADASGPVGHRTDITFADLFWETFHKKAYEVPNDAWAGITFIFELTSPHNRVVVPHTSANLVLIGARIASGQESAIQAGNIAAGYDIVKTFALKDFNEVLKAAADLDPMKSEGFVVVDGNYRRVKVKSPAYVRLHHLKDSFTLRNIVECVRRGEDVEFINYFPEHKDVVKLVKDAVHNLVEDVNDAWRQHYDIALSPKEFALRIENLRFKGILFSMRSGKARNAYEAIIKMHIDTLIDLLEVKDAQQAA